MDITKSYSMEACVRLINLTNLTDSKLIERNLHRILDVSLISFDLDNHALRFHYDDPGVYDEVIRELKRLGYPVDKCLYQGKDLPLQTS
ncbi:hypothetical protein LVD13_01105 [Flavobacteriaceae bacterium D16]|nr:hypothetical protein [Flavobacteriaceae bacterium D16]